MVQKYYELWQYNSNISVATIFQIVKETSALSQDENYAVTFFLSPKGDEEKVSLFFFFSVRTDTVWLNIWSNPACYVEEIISLFSHPSTHVALNNSSSF